MKSQANRSAPALPSHKSGNAVRLTLVALMLLVLAACTTPGAGGTGGINSFEAIPHDDGSGAWRLSWSITGSGTFDGAPIPAQAREGGRIVHPDGVRSYTLAAGTDSRTIVLAPVSSVRVTGAAASIEQGLTGSVAATVNADGSEAEPLQAISVSSSDISIVSVNDSGNLLGVSPGTATITVTSVQDASVSVEFDLEVIRPAAPEIINFSTTADPATMEAGDSITVEIEALGNLPTRLIEVVTGGVERTITEVTNGTTQVQLPADKAEVNYALRASNSAGESAEAWLWTARQPLPGWICVDPEDAISFADAELERNVWTIYGGTDLEPDDGILTCGIVQQEFFTPVPLPSDEYGLMEQHNSMVINRCEQDDDPVVTSLEGIQHLSTLLRLELMCNGIDDISRLAGLTSLQELNLDRNDVSDLSPLAGLTDLVVLGLYQNQVEDVSALSALTELRVLYLSENRIKDVAPLAGLTNLEHLWLYLNCDVADLDAGIWSGCLDDVSSLGGLHSLHSFVIHMNDISDISMLNASMTELELVFATGNRISDIASLASLPALTTARLDTNLISSVSPLAQNTAFPGGAAPYYWDRVDPGPPENTVTMPPTGVFAQHLSLHENCLDLTETQVLTDLETIAANGAIIAGQDIAQLHGGCGLTISAQTVQPRTIHNIEGLLRDDSRWYNR